MLVVIVLVLRARDVDVGSPLLVDCLVGSRLLGLLCDLRENMECFNTCCFVRDFDNTLFGLAWCSSVDALLPEHAENGPRRKDTLVFRICDRSLP